MGHCCDPMLGGIMMCCAAVDITNECTITAAFEPTMQLRWHECSHAEISATSISWGDSTYWELQQLWRSVSGEEEWRALPTG